MARYFEATSLGRQADGQGWSFIYVGQSRVEALDGCVSQVYRFLRDRHAGEGEVLDTLTYLQAWGGGDVVIAGYDTWVEVWPIEED